MFSWMLVFFSGDGSSSNQAYACSTRIHALPATHLISGPAFRLNISRLPQVRPTAIFVAFISIGGGVGIVVIHESAVMAWKTAAWAGNRIVQVSQSDWNRRKIERSYWYLLDNVKCNPLEGFTRGKVLAYRQQPPDSIMRNDFLEQE